MSRGRRSPPRDWIREEHNEAHRIEASTLYGTVIESRVVPAGTDLRKLLIETLAKWTAEGWKVEAFNDLSQGFFCSKDEKRIHVHIVPDLQPYKGHSHIMRGKSP